MTLMEGISLDASLCRVMRKEARVYSEGSASEIHRVLPWPKTRSICRPWATDGSADGWKRANDALHHLKWLRLPWLTR